MKRSKAEIVREYGPFPGADRVNGVTYDGQHVWFASGDKLNAFDPSSGKMQRSIDVAAHAGTAFDGQHLFQIAENRIQKIDPKTGRVLATIPAPGGGGDSGLAWAEGTLWVGQYRNRKIYQVDPETGAILRTIESNRFVTGVTWVDGELWHATWEGEESDLRRIDPQTGDVLETARDADWRVRFRARVRWPRSVLLRRRTVREGQDGPSASAAPRGSITLKFQLARGIGSRSGTPDHAFLGDQISSLSCRRPLGKSPTAVTQAPSKRWINLFSHMHVFRLLIRNLLKLWE